MKRKRISIAGQVQGVGFRPFVYRLAVAVGLTGWVLNDGRGVTVEVQGAPEALEEFSFRLERQLPPLARIERVDSSDVASAPAERGFEIRTSCGDELADARITPDVAVCEDCLREMNAPSDPRYGYPFINCTNCGPRYSLVARVPYDRANTTMADFEMCPFCAGEYHDPASRRFHAQPIACPACGPRVWLADPRGKRIACSDPIARAAEMLLAGKIVAIKGLGGFHLACRADDDNAVRRLRRRKLRDAKPFAVMVADEHQAGRLGKLSPQVLGVLTGPTRPIVLLPKIPGAKLSPMVAEALGTVGVMLPYTPLHHLLFAGSGLGSLPLVMTSGNRCAEPLVKDNDEAVARLSAIADALLLHDRRIARRIDDSVVQVGCGGRTGMLRRARGYAPRPISLPEAAVSSEAPAVLAVGAELNSAVCLLKGGRAVLSEHIGDLKDGRAYRHFIDTIDHLEDLFDVQPALIACDAHPAYLSGEYAARRNRGELPPPSLKLPSPPRLRRTSRRAGGRAGVRLVRVQHHHAHIAACMAENGRPGPVIGLACDGAGYGDDGAVWGCEILRADLRACERLGHLRYIRLPGGDAAAVETHRSALAVLLDAFDGKIPEGILASLPQISAGQVDSVGEVLSAGVNCPASSSLGRWFDAAAALCGLGVANRFEGEMPMKLEAAVQPDVEDSYAFDMPAAGDGQPFTIDLRPMVHGMVGDLGCRATAGYVAAKFHNTVARFLAAAARKAAESTGLKTVAMSGGCFANRYLAGRLAESLRADGFEVLRHRSAPCNDGCIALGQATVAAATAGDSPAAPAGAE